MCPCEKYVVIVDGYVQVEVVDLLAILCGGFDVWVDCVDVLQELLKLLQWSIPDGESVVMVSCVGVDEW